MAQIRIERTPIKAYYLGVAGADHLLLTYVPNEFDPQQVQDNWFVIEGIKAVGSENPFLAVEGIDGQTTLSQANGDRTGGDLVAALGTPQSRSSTVIDVPMGAFTAWQTMASFADDIDAQFLPYQFLGPPAQPIPASNSSSVIATLLHHVGVDIAPLLATGTWRYTTGATTLLGSGGDDELFVTSNFTNILGGRGSDILHGSDGGDRLNGGMGADYFYWSKGLNHLHGGQLYLDYERDGVDVVGYNGVGTIQIDYNPLAATHKMPNFITIFDGGKDFLYSIERIEWGGSTDHLILGKGVEVLQDNILFDLKGDGGGQGDKVSFLEAPVGMLVNVSDASTLVAQAETATGDKGMFILSAEWIEGSNGSDRIYANSSLRGIEGGGGDDFIDARLDSAFAGGSPAGYDIEILGGGGDDTILSGEGRTLVNGGAGSDRFVFTTVNTGGGTPEMIIEDGDAEDRLFVAYNFFNGSGGGFEGSELMPLLGTLFPFEVLQDPDGPGALNFEWQLMDDILNGDSQVPGLVDFVGRISYTLDGSDLLIHLYQGVTSLVNLAEEGLPPHYFTIIETDPEVEALIRVRNFQPGDLGIEFHDPGSPEPGENGDYYPGWDDAVAAILDGGEFLQPFDPRPAAPVYDPNSGSSGGSEVEVSGTEDADTITLTLASNVSAGGGDDQVTGSSAGDRIDGGSGADTMAGGGGDDVYGVDSAADTVVELAGSGVDLVLASADHTLADNVENLELTGTAVAGFGNALANRLTGNALDNTLDGGLGNDALSGGLGDDTLIGGAGSDFYVYFVGEGDDVVIDSGLDTDIDTLTLGFDIAPTDITLYRLAATPGDLVLAVAGGGRIIIRDYAAANGNGIERVAFEDGTTWDRAAIEAAGNAAPLFGDAPPQATDDERILVASPLGVLDAATLLANDSDPDGDALTVVAVADAVGGTVTLTATGEILVETAQGFEGVVTFRYTVADADGSTSSATATIDVVPNTDPLALGVVPDIAATANAPIDVTLPAGIFGDNDGDRLLVTASLGDGQPLPAWLAFDAATGRLTGTPPADFAGTLALRVAATDGIASAAHLFSLTVAPLNTAPVAAADSGFATPAGTALVIAAASLLANDTDPDGDTLAIASVGNAVGGTVALDPDGSVRFTPAEGFAGQAAFTYTVGDGHGASATAAVTLTVTSLPGATFAGTGGNDTFTGTAGNDLFTLIGDGGLDTIDGAGGTDTVRGSVYNDIIRLAANPANFTSIEIIDGGGGDDRILGGSGDDIIDASPFQLVSIERIDGGLGNDTITGSAGNDIIVGNVGNDTLSGGLGDDTFAVVGDGGNDTIDGGGGTDTILGSIYNDVVRIAAGASSITGIEIIDGGGGDDRILGGSGNDTIDLGGVSLVSIERIDGGLGNDTITGSAGNDTIVGNVGNDTLNGGLGNDIFAVVGDGGFDTIDGGGGTDTILGSIYNDIVRIAAGASSITGVELIDGGAGTDRILGGSGNDTIDLGGMTLVSIEQIDGGGGNDTITGSLSADVVTGGLGNDTFVFANGGGHDTITDFRAHANGESTADFIDLSASSFQDAQAVLAATVQDGFDTLIMVDGTSSIRLVGVFAGTLGIDDLIV